MKLVAEEKKWHCSIAGGVRLFLGAFGLEVKEGGQNKEAPKIRLKNFEGKKTH